MWTCNNQFLFIKIYRSIHNTQSYHETISFLTIHAFTPKQVLLIWIWKEESIPNSVRIRIYGEKFSSYHIGKSHKAVEKRTTNAASIWLHFPLRINKAIYYKAMIDWEELYMFWWILMVGPRKFTICRKQNCSLIMRIQLCFKYQGKLWLICCQNAVELNILSYVVKFNRP